MYVYIGMYVRDVYGYVDDLHNIGMVIIVLEMRNIALSSQQIPSFMT